jgi:hypothetical protein
MRNASPSLQAIDHQRVVPLRTVLLVYVYLCWCRGTRGHGRLRRSGGLSDEVCEAVVTGC